MLNRIVTVAALALGGVLISKQLKKARSGNTMSTVKESVEVNVPLNTAYNQWTQFEDFPNFMESVHEVRIMDDKHLHWRADVAGKEKEWDAEITEQIPDDRIAWRSTSGVRNAGVVTFQKLSDSSTRIMLQMDYDPETVTEKIGDAVGAVRMQTRRNLNRFKELLESRGNEPSAWPEPVARH